MHYVIRHPFEVGLYEMSFSRLDLANTCGGMLEWNTHLYCFYFSFLLIISADNSITGMGRCMDYVYRYAWGSFIYCKTLSLFQWYSFNHSYKLMISKNMCQVAHCRSECWPTKSHEVDQVPWGRLGPPNNMQIKRPTSWCIVPLSTIWRNAFTRLAKHSTHMSKARVQKW